MGPCSAGANSVPSLVHELDVSELVWVSAKDTTVSECIFCFFPCRAELFQKRSRGNWCCLWIRLAMKVWAGRQEAGCQGVCREGGLKDGEK